MSIFRSAGCVVLHVVFTVLNTIYTSTQPALLKMDIYRCPRRNGQNFGRVFLMLNYTDITQNTYIQS